MRFYEIRYVNSDGKTEHKNTSKLFAEMVKLCFDNAVELQSKYYDAPIEIYGNDLFVFVQWLSSSIYAKKIEPLVKQKV